MNEIWIAISNVEAYCMHLIRHRQEKKKSEKLVTYYIDKGNHDKRLVKYYNKQKSHDKQM